jgi:hypothetical protein
MQESIIENNIDYAIALEPFVEIAFIAERNGIAIYVMTGQASFSRNLLATKGLSSGLTVEAPL